MTYDEFTKMCDEQGTEPYEMGGQVIIVNKDEPAIQELVQNGVLKIITQKWFDWHIAKCKRIAKENEEMFNKIRFQNAELN